MAVQFPGIVPPWGDAPEKVKKVFDVLKEEQKEKEEERQRKQDELDKERRQEEEDKRREKRSEEQQKRKETREKGAKIEEEKRAETRRITEAKRQEALKAEQKKDKESDMAFAGYLDILINGDPRDALEFGRIHQDKIQRTIPDFDPTKHGVAKREAIQRTLKGWGELSIPMKKDASGELVPDPDGVNTNDINFKRKLMR
jgi:hypothetical protein